MDEISTEGKNLILENVEKRKRLRILMLVAIILFFVGLVLIYFLLFTRIDVEKASNLQLSYFKSLNPNDCRVIVRQDKIDNIWENVVEDKDGNIAYLFGNLRLFIITRNSSFFETAETQANCIESKLKEINFGDISNEIRIIPIYQNSTSSVADAAGVDNWSAYINTFTQFYLQKNKKFPNYFSDIIKYLENVEIKISNEDPIEANFQIRSFSSMPRAFINYYILSNDTKYLVQAKEKLEIISNFYNDTNVISDSELLIGYVFLFNKTKDVSLLNKIKFYKERIISRQLKDGSFCRIESKNLCTINAIRSLDTCWRLMQDIECKTAVLSGLRFLLRNMDLKNGGLPNANFKLLTPNVRFTTLLIQYKDEL